MTHKQEQFQFFYKHAGYSYDPTTQTPRQGRAATARHLASAERYFNEHDWRIEWAVGDHIEAYDYYVERGPDTCELATLYDAEGNVLSSLGCIDDADNNYKRVIRAELSLEAMENERDTQRFGLIA